MAKTRRPDSLAAEAAFRARLAELGATLLEPEWLGAQSGHRVTCSAGHACRPRPASVQQGQGICRTCAGQDSAVAEAVFRARLDELGAELLEPYVNRRTSVRVRCAAGHSCRPSPGYVMTGGGICRTCSGQDPAACEAKFLARLAALGATPLYPAWRGAGKPHEARCAAGHACQPRPTDTLQGHGICLICAGKSAEHARAAFIARLAEMGATLLETEWSDVGVPHKVRCANGHIGSPRPTHVLRGGGPCHACTHNGDWDTFYVVASNRVVKFGITTGDPRPRLRAHARDGLTEILRMAAGLPETVALDAEREVRATLALAGEKPRRGREYFDISCLALILDVADSWLTAPAKAPAVSGIITAWVQEELFAA